MRGAVRGEVAPLVRPTLSAGFGFELGEEGLDGGEGGFVGAGHGDEALVVDVEAAGGAVFGLVGSG